MKNYNKYPARGLNYKITVTRPGKSQEAWYVPAAGLGDEELIAFEFVQEYSTRLKFHPEEAVNIVVSQLTNNGKFYAVTRLKNGTSIRVELI